MSSVQDHPDIEKLPLEVDGISVRETIREIFRNPENGTPDNISKAGCLALALKSNEFVVTSGLGLKDKGFVVCNAWREKFPTWTNRVPMNCTNFSNLDLSRVQVDFSKFLFGHSANFQKSRWRHFTKFDGAQWGVDANFQETYWEQASSFDGAGWGDRANFINAEWEEGARFINARWGRTANFRSAKWGKGALFNNAFWKSGSNFQLAQWGAKSFFENANWRKSAKFSGANWGDHSVFRLARCGDDANFSGAQFGNGCDFSNARWGDRVDFRGVQFGHDCNLRETLWGVSANFYGMSWPELCDVYGDDQNFQRAQKWSESLGVSPMEFRSIDFSGASFLGDVSFTNRHFKARTNFGLTKKNSTFHNLHTTFGAAPKFHGCELHQDTSFEGAVFPSATGSEEAARAYRTLKLAFSKQQSIREEQRFFRLEMEEETLRETGLKRWLFKAYKTFSDYGFSVTRPLLLLIAAWLVFAQIYGSYSDIQTICLLGQAGCDLQGDWLSFSFQQALPLPGFEKLDHAIQGVSVGWLFLHKTISLAALFLIGLALRNLFKLK